VEINHNQNAMRNKQLNQIQTAMNSNRSKQIASAQQETTASIATIVNNNFEPKAMYSERHHVMVTNDNSNIALKET
jgi:DNA-binding TFAR19-related protein (PDSD5 family)